jgi:branched-chain amino acid transport system substrate-binding protein
VPGLRTGAAATFAALALTMAACGGEDGGQAAAEDGGEPIRVGAVSSLSGPFKFPEASAAARAVFDDVNARGGIGGRRIEYQVEDDGADPQTASQAARRLVDDAGVVANVGSASLVECAVNSRYYGQQDLLSIQGTGVDPTCFSSPNISPVNTGPYAGVAVSLFYAVEELGRERPCLFGNNVPGQPAKIREEVARWQRLTGERLELEVLSIQGDEDLTPYVLRARRAGCDVAVFTGVEPQVIAWMKAADAQGVDDVTWMFLTPAYTANVGRVLGEQDEGIYANSEFEPYIGGSSPALREWRETMERHEVPLTSFAQGGYLAARIFVDVLEGIEGQIDRASVTAALRELTAYDTDFIGSPYAFGPGEAHNPNRSSKFVRLEGGRWRVVIDDWVSLPAA